MRIEEILSDIECALEEVFVDDDNNILSEAAVRQWKRTPAAVLIVSICAELAGFSD